MQISSVTHAAPTVLPLNYLERGVRQAYYIGHPYIDDCKFVGQVLTEEPAYLDIKPDPDDGEIGFGEDSDFE